MIYDDLCLISRYTRKTWVFMLLSHEKDGPPAGSPSPCRRSNRGDYQYDTTPMSWLQLSVHRISSPTAWQQYLSPIRGGSRSDHHHAVREHVRRSPC